MTSISVMGRRRAPQPLALFVVFLICGVAVLFLGSNFYQIFPTNNNLGYNLAICAIFLAATLLFKYDHRWNPYWRITFAAFVASTIYPITSLTAGWKSVVMGWFGLAVEASSQGIAVDKLLQMILTVIPILWLIKLSGADFGSIYLKRGNLKWGLSIGALVLLNFAASAFLFFAMRFTSLDTLLAATLWGMVFALANSFLEELWFRGIFLRRLHAFLGVGGSVLLTSIVFALIHAGATFLTPVAIPFMVANTFTLGLACGYLTMKTDSLWGAVLIHAAADLYLFVAMLGTA